MFADLIIHSHDWTIGGLAILIVVIGALAGIVYVALRAFGVTIPPWVIHIMWIVIVAFVAIVAIRLVLSM